MKFPQFVTTAKLGKNALSTLKDALREAQRDDIFARTVIVADHPDVASAVRHSLGQQNVINVTVQTGERLAAELAAPMLHPLDGDTRSHSRTLDRLHESQVVRQVAQGWLKSSGNLGLSEAGTRRLCAEFAEALRQWEQRPASAAGSGASPADEGVIELPGLYDEYHALLDSNGFHTRYELPALAAQALEDHWPKDKEPAVIYYLPGHLSAGELGLMQTLLERGKCHVIIGLTGDGVADAPAMELERRLAGAPEATTSGDETALRIAAGKMLFITVAPDPVEEVRTVVRRIASLPDETPFHRVAVVHRQQVPYASLVRQELAYADIPYTGVPRRTLADTTAGRFLLGILALAGATGGDTAGPVIDRQLLTDLLISGPLLFVEDGEPRRIPGVRWANLAREAHANGRMQQWTGRLKALAMRQAQRRLELTGDPPTPDDAGIDPDAALAELEGAGALITFLTELAPRLERLRNHTASPWDQAAKVLESLLGDYLFSPYAEQVDRASVEKMLTGLADLNAGYSLEALRDAVANGLQSPVTARGNPVGSGVYVGPPAGVIGGDYDAVFVVGMIEGQFPPPHRTTAFTRWLDQGSSVEDRDAQERYEFLGVVAAAKEVALSYPVAGADRRAAYPSRWLLEAADLIRLHVAPESAAVTSENLTTHPDLAQWRTVVQSREDSLRQLSATGLPADSKLPPAHRQDYDLMHLLSSAGTPLPDHPAWTDEPRLKRAVAAAQARRSDALTEWDGLVGPAVPVIAAMGDALNPVSPSALETWAACPYRYFLRQILRLYAPPEDDDDDQISPLERGVLVHRILELFVKDRANNKILGTVDDLLELADVEFKNAEGLGITGYPLLWEMEQEKINTGLRSFFDADKAWLQQYPSKSDAEKRFENATVDAPGIGPIHFKGTIDRIDVLDGEVRVRDFKTGRPGNYGASANTVSQPSVRPEDLPGIAQETLDKLRALAAERKDENDETDRWYREHLAPGMAVVEKVLQVADDPSEAAQELGDGKAITQAGRLRKSDAWFRDLAEVKEDFVQAGKTLSDAVKDAAKQPQQANGGSPRYSVANGRALQLPVYLAAVRDQFGDSAKTVSASYCFPLAENGPAHDVGTYTGHDGQEEVFRQTLTHIIGAARKGVYPATPEDAPRGNCHYCDFKQLCPTRRRQFWERKGRHDPRVRPFNSLRGSAAIEINIIENGNAD